MANDCGCGCNPKPIPGHIPSSSTIKGRIYAPTYVKGADGKSAYEIAVEHGFVGTEEEWLASLQGEDGRSAYQIAVDAGYVGTEEEWLRSLQGDDGKSAYEIAVEHGYQGTEEEWIEEIEGNAEKVAEIELQLDDMNSTLVKYGTKLEPIFEAEDETAQAGNPVVYKLVVAEKEEDDTKDYTQSVKMTASEINDICVL